MNMDTVNVFIETLNQAREKIKKTERLAPEACMEELCKLLLVKLYYERKTLRTLAFSLFRNNIYDNPADRSYENLFRSYVPCYLFEGWDRINLKRRTFEEVVTLLESINLYETDCIEAGKAFTSFLQAQYGGYINDYSTPDILTKYIFDVLGIESIKTVFDPCCGIGGMLAEAYCRKGCHLMLAGNDISQTMVNITQLHLKMYGYEGEDFTCSDYTDKRKGTSYKGYDCIVAHIPTRRQIYSAIHRSYYQYGDDYFNFEEFFIENVVKHLNIDGFAVIILPKNMVERHDKRYLRHYLMEKTEIVNITQFNDVAYHGHSTKKDYQILFLKNSGKHSYGECTATLLSSCDSIEDINNAAKWVNSLIMQKPHNSELPSCKYFSHREVENWNISLLFIRDKIGKKYAPVLLEDILTRRRELAQIIPDKKYNILRVRRRGLGVEVKRTELGGDIHDTMFVTKANDLVISSFEADMGGIGHITKEFEGGIVTKDLYLFEVDKRRVDLNYLLMVLTSAPVLEQLQVMNKREYMLSRISLSKLMSVMIPLPDIDTQKSMAKELQRFIDKAQKAEDELAEGRKSFSKNLFG